MLAIKKENIGDKYISSDLFSVFGLDFCDRTAIIGCGGKTSLMYALAAEKRDKSVLITTTTRIFRPPAHVYDFEMDAEIKELKNGIYLYSGDEKDGKLFPPPKDVLANVQSLFDCVFIEADGSKMRPLKGWADHEPVVPDFVTATVAVATTSPIDEIVSEKNTHRLPVFSEITGAAEGEAVTAAHIAAMISHPRGMLQKAIGTRILFINQVESENDRKYAAQIFEALPKSFLQSLSRIVIGSLKQNSYEVIWEGQYEKNI